MKLWLSEFPSAFWLHPSHQLPMRTVVITVALLLLGVLMATAFPTLPESRGIASYLPLHTLLETLAVVIAMLVFAVGWNAYRRGLPGNILLLACAFLGVGMLDFTHMISYAGMPDFVTPSSREKAIDFWLSARSLAATALFIVSVTPWRPLASAASRYLLLAAALILTGGLHWLFLFHDDLMPRTFIPGQGLTPFKIYYEYALVALNLATALVLWMRMRKPLPFNAAALFGAVCAMALSEFFFTLYVDVADIYNLLGHIYKTVSYLFLYRAIFVETIELPYTQLHATQNQLQATLDAIRISNDLLQSIVKNVPVRIFWKNRNLHYLGCNTGFAKDAGFSSPEKLIGKTDFEMGWKDQAELYRADDKSVMESGNPKLDFEEPSTAPDGNTIWLSTSKVPLRDENNQVIGILGIYQDITARKLAETLRGGQQQVLEMIASGAPLPETLAALLRFVEAQSPGMLGSILLLDEDGVHVRHGASPSLPAEFVAAIDGQPIGPCAGSCGTAIYRREAVFVEDIATDPLWANYKAVALPHGLRACWSTPIFDAQRQVLGTFAMYYRQPGVPQTGHLQLIDTVTHIAAIAISRHREEEVLGESEEHYRTLFESMLNGFAYCRMLFEDGHPKDFIYLDVNEAFEKQTGLKNVVGKRVSEVIPGIREADPALLERYGRVAAGGKPEQFETYVKALGMWFLISVYCPKPDHFVVIFDVITARKQAEEKIRAQLGELLRWQEVTLGREERVQQLKVEVNEQLARQGEPARYSNQAE